jgi:fructose-1,6-bisphosphatase
MSLYSKVQFKLSKDFDHIVVELVCDFYDRHLNKTDAYKEIKNHIQNNQKQADILHILACIRNFDLVSLPRVEPIVKLLRDTITTL